MKLARLTKSSVCIAAFALCIMCACGGSSSSTPAQPSSVKITLVSSISGFSAPVGIQTLNDGTRRLFVVEQGGTIRFVQNSAILPPPFLDIRSKVTSGGEEGLLGLAFDPNYVQNGRFFVHYDRTVNTQAQSGIAEYARSAADPNVADPASERILLTVNQPFGNHKGGQLAFGPDGFLYIGLGDGGSAGDPLGNAQNRGVLLGKMLRIDVDHTSPGLQYAIPSDNPFLNG